MDSQAISLVRSNFKAIAAVQGGPQTLARNFYALLFAWHPEVREFFPAAMDVQRDRLISAIQYAIERLEDSGQILLYLEQLGRDHRKYGVKDAHYVGVSQALISAVEQFPSAEPWTDELEQAWRDVLALLSATMMDAANAESGPPAWGATVIEHLQVREDVSVTRLQLDEPMSYAAGQYVSVQVPSRPRMWRYLSPANPANDQGIIEFHVRRVSGGWVSPAVVNQTLVDERWLIGSPLGDLGVRNDNSRDILMIGSGTGIAPLRAQILQMSQRSQSRRVHVFFAGRYPCDLYDLGTLWALAEQNPWLTVVPVTEQDEDPWWYRGPNSASLPGMHRRLTGKVGEVVADFGTWAERDIQLIGSESMMKTTKFRLHAAGTPPENIRHDPSY
ncbi:FAD-binding oxidoreductase [Rhodococcus marinonascens]|uniref:FAD-binding oxidoreductase n=1 Tax=Rhodococcus marinonascens TaxID=38311 RepID=UPI00093262AE|nr:FAD-binding oxidoreductase [Rhodococcus marinonascens]